MNILKLARRNIWRNKRRTLITAGSIMFAVFFSIVVSSIQKGTWDHMVDSVVKYHFGYAQIHKNGFWEEQTIDHVFDRSHAEAQLVNQIHLSNLVPRIENFALASNGNKTKGVLVVGIDPRDEDGLTKLTDRLSEGAYLSDNDNGVLLSSGLAEYLKIDLQDTVLMIGQGYHGTNAAGKFPVRGLVDFASPDLNKRLLYMPVDLAEWFYGTENQITSLVLDIDNPDRLPQVMKQVKAQLDLEQYEVLDYEEMMPELIEAKELDTAGGKIILLVLYIIIGFGVFGTILMMLKERQYEIGILKAIGMKSRQISWMVWLETILIGIIGTVAGMLLALPLIYYFKQHPIRMEGKMAEAYEKFGVDAVIPTAMDWTIFVQQALTIFIIISLLSLYAIWKVKSLHPIKAMRT